MPCFAFLFIYVTAARGFSPPVEIVHPHSFYWQMAGAKTSTSTAGFSFYTRIFSLFDESLGGLPANMQMGMGGTWLTPTNISWAKLPKDVCACNPKGWPSASKGDQAFGCCEKDTRCSFLYETFEGGPGYWEVRTSQGAAMGRGCESLALGHDCTHSGHFPKNDT